MKKVNGKEKPARGPISEASCAATKLWARKKFGTIKAWTEYIGVEYMTAWGWVGYGHAPNFAGIGKIQRKTPDCPLLKGIGVPRGAS